MPEREGQLRRLAESYTAAWCSQNAARVAGFYAPDGSLRVNADPTAVGRDAIAGVAQGFIAAFPDLKEITDDTVLVVNGLPLEKRGYERRSKRDRETRSH
jgi:uncharacterized protein (TIGR02246 family)